MNNWVPGTCTFMYLSVRSNNDRTKEADVLERTDKYMKVQVPGTQLFIEMFRDDVNIPYTGHTAGLEFEWQPRN